MGIATPPPILHQLIEKSTNSFTTSMSRDYHQTIFSFSNGFERSTATATQQDHQNTHIAHQIRRDNKLRGQGLFEPSPQTLVGMEEEESGGLPVYETAGMLSEMFNFPPAGTTADAVQLLESNYRTARPPPPPANEWYGNRNNSHRDNLDHHHHHHISGINPDSAAAMHLFLMNPQPRSPSPPPPPPQPSTSSTLHMLLPNPSPYVMSTPSQFTWVPENNNSTENIGRIVEGQGQGLSLSLSSSLQHFEAAKAEELRMGDGGGLLYYDDQAGGGASSSGQQQPMNHQVHVGFGSYLGVVNVLRNSKYAKATQELLEEFCSVGRGQFKKNKFSNKQNSTNPNSNNPGGNSSSGGGGGGGGSSLTKDLPLLSSTDRIEHQRKKVKLLSLLDEVDRRYQHYCEQMQMVVNSFDLVMGFGAAVPYTALAQKAMSRHFRCLKDAIAAQLKHSCELLGDKDGAAGSSGITVGETPRLKLLERSLRQQRAFHQMGMMEQEAWRPQRGLPERSVSILRAWLFEHFLHPYPSDADKHLLARQTGLSRNQVSNWFINARVRLWKPMVEDMYQQEAKEEEEDGGGGGEGREKSGGGGGLNAQTPTPPTTTSSSSAPTISTTMPANENDTSLIAINTQSFSENQANNPPPPLPSPPPSQTHHQQLPFPDSFDQYHGPTTSTSGNAVSTAFIRFGATPGDVSLTLGLRHAGNMPPDKNTTSSSPFSVRDFGGC
ncbi:BEL1-like homeodomain protein 4 [Tripterygium wilfordii]|uniref:BEL1-like homeodomain protein 4 n=1 Tax=Tripterygium wilfordii TaxID=458696 RepID=A0A7J7E2W3_TRIWF|nr:BEL1-like homeodomain protein 4 [Tripterygium wilfordii]KAF5752945.1 BEL1-like homeodomain protein 4 [Tripterygium wilfordii]